MEGVGVDMAWVEVDNRTLGWGWDVQDLVAAVFREDRRHCVVTPPIQEAHR